MELISVLFMVGAVLLGAIYLLQVIFGKRKPGDYKNIDGISGFGTIVIIFFGGAILLKEIIDEQTIKEHPIFSIFIFCSVCWFACRLLVFGKDKED